MIRTRFAPSPTGDLHIGGVRTALYSYLYAKKHQGEFILRIEDTDVERSTQAATDNILAALNWLGLNNDGDIYYQSKRLDRYTDTANPLVKQNLAYKCDCSAQRLIDLRQDQLANKQKPKYDGRCLNRQADINTNYVIRFRSPQTGNTSFTDLIHGQITINNSELDDFIILRSDGLPTFHLAVAVDDTDMKITHVIRGDDHLSNTARHVNLITALQAPIPQYAHLAMVLGKDGQKLSKRNGVASVLDYRNQGFLPETILNGIVRLGWSHGDQEIFSMTEMTQFFDFDKVQKSPARLDIEKLQWLNKKYLANLNTHSSIAELTWHFNQLDIDITNGPKLIDILALQANKQTQLNELAEASRYFYQDIDTSDLDPSMIKEIAQPLQSVLTALLALEDWQADQIKPIIKQTVADYGLNFAALGKPLRHILSGAKNTADLSLTIFYLGKESVKQRIEATQI